MATLFQTNAIRKIAIDKHCFSKTSTLEIRICAVCSVKPTIEKYGTLEIRVGKFNKTSVGIPKHRTCKVSTNKFGFPQSRMDKIGSRQIGIR